MSEIDETIAAIITAPGEAGVAIVRVSGPRALEIGDAVFRCAGAGPSTRDANTLIHGHVVSGRDKTGEEDVLDEVLLLVMRGPQSYTAEDVIEIQGHGGSAASKRILRRVLEAGARMAEPGEFTRRAFINGRIDLVQAEAVLDLIRAHSDRAAAAAVEQLEGGLSRKFDRLYEELLGVASDIESTLDFPEDELPEYVMPEILKRLERTQDEYRDLLVTWEEGHLLRDGALVVISGKPNVGKSTLLNALLGIDRAIVTDIPGTTRDTIEEGFVLGGVPVRLVDTAGLRDAECVVEQMGVERSRAHIRRADMHIHVMDASAPGGEDALAGLEGLSPDRCIVVLNKVDLGDAFAEDRFKGFATVKTCLVQGQGVDGVKAAMLEKLEQHADLASRPHAVINERHRRLLVDAGAEIDAALEMLGEQQEDLVPLASSRLRTALDLVGTATGRTYEEELLDNIFSRFCIGK